MFLGQYAPAIAAADELIETMPEAMLRIPSPPMADFFESYVSIRQHVLIRFGKWREIIAQELPADGELYCNTVAMTHYAKGVAHAALGDVSAAEIEQALFQEAAKRVPESRQIHNVKCVQLLAIAEEMLTGEIAYRRGEHDAAFAHLRAAIALEDDLPYDEPWGWMQPVRHALGALLLEQGRAAEAEVLTIDLLGFRGAPLFQQQGTERVAHRLHPAPGLVVGQVVLQRDGGAQPREGCVMFASAVGDLALQHLLGNGQQLHAANIMDLPRLWHAQRGRAEQCLFGLGRRHVAQRGVRDALRVVRHRHGVAIKLAVLRQALREDFVPLPEADQDMLPDGNVTLEEIRHRR
jgi:hypothetical protein